jgi:hypothetical protein
MQLLRSTLKGARSDPVKQDALNTLPSSRPSGQISPIDSGKDDANDQAGWRRDPPTKREAYRIEFGD